MVKKETDRKRSRGRPKKTAAPLRRPDIDRLRERRPYRRGPSYSTDNGETVGFIEISDVLRDELISYIEFLEANVAPGILQAHDSLSDLQLAAITVEAESHFPDETKELPHKRPVLALFQVSAETISKILSERGLAAEVRTISNWRANPAYEAAVRKGVNELYAKRINAEDQDSRKK